MVDETMIQDNVYICPQCRGGLRKIQARKDILYVCSYCSLMLRVIGQGQSERELKCEVVR